MKTVGLVTNFSRQERTVCTLLGYHSVCCGCRYTSLAELSVVITGAANLGSAISGHEWVHGTEARSVKLLHLRWS
jgi:hypothetical protein